MQILSPDKKEIEDIERSIKLLETMWSEMDLSEPPKVHLLFVHTMAQI